ERLASFADFEVKPGLAYSRGIADSRHDVARRHTITHAPIELLVVAVKAHVTVPVIEHEQQAEPWQPIGIDDSAVKRRANLRAPRCSDHDALPLERPARTQLAESCQHLAADRPGQLAPHALERLLRKLGEFLDRPPQLRDQVLERPRVALQLGEL